MQFTIFQKLFRCSSFVAKAQSYNFSSKSTLSFECLKNRTLLRLSGSETKSYLQSMMTNDINYFEVLPSMYSLLLNARGSVLYDILLYQLAENEYLLEYDSTAVEYLERHLLMYRLRKDVKIQPLKNINAWAIYSPMGDLIERNTLKEIFAYLNKADGIVKVVEDPRIKQLGVRVLTNTSVELSKVLQPSSEFIEDESYRLLRYKLGVGEGVLDHPPGKCSPFDINIDLLNGVSLTKGCYIGQEMTAKSQHVFAIRRRIMPIVLQEMESYPAFSLESPIVNETNQKMGRLRSHLGKYGLGFLKYEDCELSQVLKLKDYGISLKASKPSWWPSNLRSRKFDINNEVV